jgi:hypothetical protein
LLLERVQECTTPLAARTCDEEVFGGLVDLGDVDIEYPGLRAVAHGGAEADLAWARATCRDEQQGLSSQCIGRVVSRLAEKDAVQRGDRFDVTGTHTEERATHRGRGLCLERPTVA